eukprot:gnl/MRDRNA2_/MRDRNA2_88061_c0_seq1.p1 gnl/MRDRNA2_/MRDRNA2_88061_c0~~gnl/MRDRNA2_/MRDRNA2_88061_c0_seq1.p1  ORF type:complete len:298 (+),score=69.76 gnl/MRDRNA2_/MRDRNA2_88061_c0_seq1:85-978(+)
MSNSFHGCWNFATRKESGVGSWTEDREELTVNADGSFHLVVIYAELDPFDGYFEKESESITGTCEVVGMQDLVTGQTGNPLTGNWLLIDNKEPMGIDIAEIDNDSCEIKLKATVGLTNRWDIVDRTIQLHVMASIPAKFLPQGEDQMKGSVLKQWREAFAAAEQKAKHVHALKKTIDSFARDLFTVCDENCRDYVDVEKLPKVTENLGKYHGPVEEVKTMFDSHFKCCGDKSIHMDVFVRVILQALSTWAEKSSDNFAQCRTEVQSSAGEIRKLHQKKCPSAYIDPFDIDDIRFRRA